MRTSKPFSITLMITYQALAKKLRRQLSKFKDVKRMLGWKKEAAVPSVKLR